MHGIVNAEGQVCKGSDYIKVENGSDTANLTVYSETDHCYFFVCFK